MTKPMMDLKELMEKSADAGLLREMIGFAAERLMELEVGQDRRRLPRKEPGADGAKERLPRARLADARRQRRTAHRDLVRREAGDQRRARGHQGIGWARPEHDMAALPRAFPAQRSGSCGQEQLPCGLRVHCHGLRPARPQGGENAVAARRRPKCAARSQSSPASWTAPTRTS